YWLCASPAVASVDGKCGVRPTPFCGISAFQNGGYSPLSGKTPDPRTSLHDRVRLDLYQHVGIDQPADLHHGGRRTDGPKHLAVGAPDSFPVARDIRHVDPGTDDVVERGAGTLERAPAVRARLHGLQYCVTLA